GLERRDAANLGFARALGRRHDGVDARRAVRACASCAAARHAEGTAMTAAAQVLPLRLALRELRGGLRGFYVFIACTALGVMAIAAVGAFSAGLAAGLAREGRTILGADVSFILSQREASAEELAFLDAQGRLSISATTRAMAR